MKIKLNYIVIPLIVIAIAFLGALFTSEGVAERPLRIGPSWYSSLEKPHWVPDPTVFKIVWTTIYVLTAVSAIIAYNNSLGVGRREIVLAFLVNANLNYLWNYIFFVRHRLGMAVWWSALLAMSVFIIMYLLWKYPAKSEKKSMEMRSAALLLSPYFLWVSFATYLSYTIFTLN